MATGRTRKTPPRRGAGNDGDALFRTAMRDAVPLKRRSRQPAASPREEAASPAPAGAPPKQATSKPSAASRPGAVEPPPAPPPRLEPGRAVGIDRRQAERLRRGKLPIEARLDLHGLSQAEAHRALNAFIAAGAAAGRRCVLVITGKGAPRARPGDEHGPGAPVPGVLRARVPDWLNAPPCRAHVLAFAPAVPAHGGAGALYVLLRRPR